MARTFLSGPGSAPSWQLSWALVGFAPGLVGYALMAHLGRVLYARQQGRDAALATVAGWVVVGVPVAWLVHRAAWQPTVPSPERAQVSVQ